MDAGAEHVDDAALAAALRRRGRRIVLGTALAALVVGAALLLA